MMFEHRTFWLSKDAQDPSGYEDAFSVDDQRGVAAICDGVSTTLFSGRWAGILAQAVVAAPPQTNNRESLDAWLKRTREAWAKSIDENALAWHQKPKLLDGAGTTLLWIEVSPMSGAGAAARPYEVRAYSVGDCCLFHVRNGQVLQTFPIQDSSRFEENPRILRSVFKKADVVAFEAMETLCNPGDLLMLCTDAMAGYTMRQLEAGGNLDWSALWSMSQPEWQQWVVQLRQANQIRYDDSTAILVRVGEPSPVAAFPKIVTQKTEQVLDSVESKLGDAWKSLKGSLRKGLRDLSESKWLDEQDKK